MEATGVVKKMRRGLLLVALILVMKLRCCQSRCGEEPASRRGASSDVRFFMIVD